MTYYYTTYMTEVGGRDIERDAPIFKASTLEDMLQDFVTCFWSDDGKPLSKQELKAMTQEELDYDHEYKYLVVAHQSFERYWQLADDKETVWYETTCGEELPVFFGLNDINGYSKYYVLPEVDIFGHTWEKNLSDVTESYRNWKDKKSKIYVFSLEEGDWI